jgi:hypothetical protein
MNRKHKGAKAAKVRTRIVYVIVERRYRTREAGDAMPRPDGTFLASVYRATGRNGEHGAEYSGHSESARSPDAAALATFELYAQDQGFSALVLERMDPFFYRGEVECRAGAR